MNRQEKIQDMIVKRHLPYNKYLDMIESEGLNCKAELYNVLTSMYQNESYTPFKEGLDNALKVGKEKITAKNNMIRSMHTIIGGPDGLRDVEEEYDLLELEPRELLARMVRHIAGSIKIQIEE